MPKAANGRMITATGRHSLLRRLWNRNKIAYFFLFPWLIGISLFYAIPMLVSLILSFTNYNFSNDISWVGMHNYVQMVTSDTRFVKSLSITFKYVLIGVPLQLIMALGLALMLNKGIRGLSIFRAIYYVPSLLGGSVAIAILWRQVFGREGIFNDFLLIFGIEPISWISNPTYAIYTLILLKIWQFGSPMVIFLAGLRQIPSELYEASAIDGAGKMQMFWRVTLPMLTPILFFNTVMQFISAFQAFTPAFVIGGGSGGPLDSILFYTLYLYIKAFNDFQMGYASALAWVMLLIISFFTTLIFLSSRKWVHYDN
jgi:multiple sugar transport system permease protein